MIWKHPHTNFSSYHSILSKSMRLFILATCHNSNFRHFSSLLLWKIKWYACSGLYSSSQGWPQNSLLLHLQLWKFHENMAGTHTSHTLLSIAIHQATAIYITSPPFDDIAITLNVLSSRWSQRQISMSFIFKNKNVSLRWEWLLKSKPSKWFFHALDTNAPSTQVK